MRNGTFTTEDKATFVSFINFVCKEMQTGNWKTDRVMEYVRLLGYCQKDILGKIDSNILESVKLHEPKPKKKGK